jgi:hypothetical protein
VLATDTVLHSVSAVFIFAAAAVPIYLSFKLKNTLRKLSLALSIFIVIHGFYHLFGSLGFDFLADSVFEPASAAALLAFGALYLAAGKRREKRQVSAS